MKKKFQWLIAIVLCIGISLVQLYAPEKIKDRMHQIVYSSDDVLYIRSQFTKLFKDDSNIKPVFYPSTMRFHSIEPYLDGFIVQIEDTKVRANGDGIILYTGTIKNFGKTMTVFYDQDEVKVTYGFLHTIEQLPYIQIKHDYLLATVNRKKEFYIQVEKEGETYTLEQTKRWLQIND